MIPPTVNLIFVKAQGTPENEFARPSASPWHLQVSGSFLRPPTIHVRRGFSPPTVRNQDLGVKYLILANRVPLRGSRWVGQTRSPGYLGPSQASSGLWFLHTALSSSLTRFVALGPLATSRLALVAMSVRRGPRGHDFLLPFVTLPLFWFLSLLSLLYCGCVEEGDDESNEPELKRFEMRFWECRWRIRNLSNEICRV
ncbi:hypothetical protein Syun_011308 [Stephania yunnanensis]|uniref:Uncharacterized protein n=1 Tax=Stephania yunnanensis TaxID=152371 RepID=A0AAP0PEA4_9MAGN